MTQTMRRFWMITNPDAIAELQKIEKERKKARKALNDFGKEIGATNTGAAETLFQSVTSVAFMFDTPPDKKQWKQIDGGWWLPRATAKALKKQCDELAKNYPSSEPVAKMIGVNCWIDSERFSLCAPKFVGIKKSWYFSTTDPKFNGNKHVVRVPDVDMERMFK